MFHTQDPAIYNERPAKDDFRSLQNLSRLSQAVDTVRELEVIWHRYEEALEEVPFFDALYHGR